MIFYRLTYSHYIYKQPNFILYKIYGKKPDFAKYLGVTHVLVDKDRINVPISGTMICLKKQKRHIVDFGRTILWKDTDKLTTKEIRQKKLKKLLNE